MWEEIFIHFMLSERTRFDFVRAQNVFTLNRNNHAKSGLAVATVTARAVDPGAGGLGGITVKIGGRRLPDPTGSAEYRTVAKKAGAEMSRPSLFYGYHGVARGRSVPGQGVVERGHMEDRWLAAMVQ
jgi:hypothetical protein